MTDRECPMCRGKGVVPELSDVSDLEMQMLRARYADDGRVIATYKALAERFGLSLGKARERVAHAEMKTKYVHRRMRP